MASARALAWIERLAWIYIYTGLFAVVLGIASLGRSNGAAWSLMVIGAALTVAGIVLIWVRSRLRETG
jgi:predicted membrane channel-forming protein YqfA (hemolysin III family)